MLVSSDIDGEEEESVDDTIVVKEKDMKNLTREVRVVKLHTIRQESSNGDKECEGEQDNPKKRASELQLQHCLFHRVHYVHEMRMMKMREEATFIDIDDFLKLYSGDYLLLENVLECFELIELVFCVYNSKSQKFHLIRTRVNRQNSRKLELMKNHFVQFDFKNRYLKIVENVCSCYYHL